MSIKSIIKKVLWIDDSQNWASITQENIKIVCAQNEVDLLIVSRVNGENLDTVFMSIDFDAIVMDFHMEPFTGDEYIRQIREQEHLDGIPIIFYSQDPDAKLEDKISDFKNVITSHRSNLEETLKNLLLPKK